MNFFRKPPDRNKCFTVRIRLPLSNLTLNILSNNNDRQQHKLKKSLRRP